MKTSLAIEALGRGDADVAGGTALGSAIDALEAGSVFHSVAWNRIVSDVFGTEFSYLVAVDGNDLVGAMPCHLVRRPGEGDMCYSPPRVHEVSYGGPVAVRSRSALVEKALVDAAMKLGRHTIVDIFNAPENSQWVQRAGMTGSVFETAYVDLRPDLDEIWAHSVDSKRRNMVRKAEKSSVRVTHCGADSLPKYLELVDQTVRRAGFRAQPPEYYRRVVVECGTGDAARLLLAERDGEVIAGGIFLRTSDIAYYWHGASATNAGNLGQGEALQWAAIQWAKAGGCRSYDLVGIERERLPNIALFKLGFTKTIVPFVHVSRRRATGRLALKARRTLRQVSGL